MQIHSSPISGWNDKHSTHTGDLYKKENTENFSILFGYDETVKDLSSAWEVQQVDYLIYIFRY